MKIRFDFVTNSSSSSFVAFNIKNKELAKICTEYLVPVKTSAQSISGLWSAEESNPIAGTPGFGSIAEWFETLLDPHKNAVYQLDNNDYSDAIEYVEKHKNEIDEATEFSEISSAHVVSDGGGTYVNIERREKGTITAFGADDGQWNYTEMGEALWQILEGYVRDEYYQKVKDFAEKSGTLKEVPDPWYKEETISDIFDTLRQDDSLENKKCCLTGDFSYGSKSEFEKYITERGGSVSPSMTKTTQILIVGSKGSVAWSHNNYGSKVEKALQYRKQGADVRIIREQDFLSANIKPVEKSSPEKTNTVAVDSGNAFLQPVKGVVEYEDCSDYDVNISKTDAEKEWKVKIVKKTKSAEISNYTGMSCSVEIPAYIDEYPVKKVGVISATPNKIKKVVVPSTVESLTDKTFKKCCNLEGLIISKNTQVPFGAFEKCDSLGDENGCVVVAGKLYYLVEQSDVIITDGVKEIADGVACHADSVNGKIRSIHFPESLTRIGKESFCGHPKLSQLVFPTDLEEIDDGAFAYNSGLKSVSFNEGLKKLHGFYAAGLSDTVKIPDTVNDFNAFIRSAISGIVLSKNIIEIPDYCFYECANLESIIIPDGVERIGANAFGSCCNLHSVTLPDSVREIGSQAFISCEQAVFHYTKHKITFPSNAFMDCNDLFDENGFQIFNDTLIKYNGSNEIVDIPNNINRIGECAFVNNPAIKKIVINNADIIFGDGDGWAHPFKGCSGLADDQGFVIVNNILFDYIGYDSEVTVPDEVECIATHCFTNNSVKTVHIPASVQSMGNYAFYKETDVIFSSTVPFVGSQWMFAGDYDFEYVVDENNRIAGSYTSDGSNARTMQWKSEKMQDGLLIIGDCLVKCDKEDSIIEIPSGIRSIANLALGSKEYDAVYLPEGLEYIAPNSLGNTKKVYLPETIKHIDTAHIHDDYAGLIVNSCSPNSIKNMYNRPVKVITAYVHKGIDTQDIIDKSNEQYTFKYID